VHYKNLVREGDFNVKGQQLAEGTLFIANKYAAIKIDKEKNKKLKL